MSRTNLVFSKWLSTFEKPSPFDTQIDADPLSDVKRETLTV